jgi:hypothetical protein
MFESHSYAARVEIILDVSGSMNAKIAGERKIDIAKRAIRSTVQDLEEGSIVALRFYSHRVPQEKKEESCKDTELVISFEPLDRNKFINALGVAIPRGWTPIAYTLEQAAEDIRESKEESVLILVSDGEETCGGDPVAVACRLMKEGFKVKIHTVGFDVDAVTRKQLEEIAKCGGGEYRDARNAGALSESLKSLTKEALLLEEQRGLHGQEIRGGKNYDEAVEIKAGTPYYLDHHLRKDEYEYFYVEVKDGQKLTASVTTAERGITIRGDEFFEQGGSPYAGIEIHDPQRQKLADEVIIGTPNATKKISVPVGSGQGGRFYILTGNRYDPQHREARFTLELVDMFDADSQKDAGESSNDAVEVKPGALAGYLHINDRIDTFKFKVLPGAKYSFRARPIDPKVVLSLAIEDQDGKVLKTAEAPNDGAAVRIDPILIPQSSEAIVKVISEKFEGSDVKYSSKLFESKYDLEITENASEVKASKEEKPTKGEPEGGREREGEERKEGRFPTLWIIGGGAIILFLVVVVIVLAVMLGKRGNQ